MSDSRELALTFQKLQTVCSRLIRNTCIDDLLLFERTLEDVDAELINKCHEYLLFPVRVSLTSKQNEKELIKLLDIASYILNKSRLCSISFFSDITIEIVEKISNLEKSNSASEELKFSICQCVSSIILSSSEEVHRYMYGSSFKLQLAFVFHTLLSLLQHERSKSLRKAILRSIGLFCYSKEFISLRDAKTEATASNSLAFYLPGLSVGLSAVVCGDRKQGESVIRMALKILADVIVITVNDCCPVSASETDSKELKQEYLQSNACLSEVKNSKWFEEVASKLGILIKNTTVLVTHDRWLVRQDFLSFAESILLSCTRNLQSSVPVLLSIIFALSVDSHKDISQRSQKLISKFSKKFQDMNSLSLCSLIEDEVYTSASSLIRRKLSASDEEKLFILRSLYGCLQVLGTSLDKILLSVCHLEKLMLSLLNLLEFETNVLMVEEISVNFDISSANVLPKKRFCHFEKKEILDTICSICHCLGKNTYNRLVIDCLLDKLHTSDIFVLPSIFLVGCIAEGFSKDHNVDLVSDIIDELMAPAIFDVQLHGTDNRLALYNDHSKDYVYNDNNIYQICLVLEALEKCSKALGKSFRVFLMKVLFNIMEKAGSSNYMISQSGKICLYSIAHYCEYSPRVELVRDNADYLVNSIILNYQHIFYKPEMSAVLQVVLQESDGEMLPMFKDCIQRLLSLLDYNQEKALPVMAILKSVVLYVRKWFTSSKSHDSKAISNGPKDLKAYFLARKKRKEESVSSEVEDLDYKCLSDCDEKEQEDSVQESEEKVPLHATIVSKILKQCSHFQSARNLQLRVLVLEIMELSIIALSDFEREQHPLVHQLWDSFVKRFSEENVVVLQAFKVLLVIADECRDFVRARCIKDVVPRLTAMLKNKFSDSLLKHFAKSYQWSNDCKLHLCVLSEIGDLFLKLEVAEKDIALLAEVCLPYLQKTQPKVFREAAFRTLQALSVIDPDAMWFYFNIQYSDKQLLTPPHTNLQPIHFSYANQIEPQFKLDC